VASKNRANTRGGLPYQIAGRAGRGEGPTMVCSFWTRSQPAPLAGRNRVQDKLARKREEQMRKMMLLAVMVAMAALMMAAAPALANDHKDWNDKDWNDKDWNDKDWNDKDWNNHNRFNDDDFCHFFDCNNDDHKRFNDDDFCHFFDCNNDDDNFDRDFDFDDLDFDSDQDADSGDVDQTYVVTNTGDNSNQCVGIQGAANTGNAQNQTGLTQLGSHADDFDFDDGGSSLEVSPTNTTTCDQQVNQAATAYDGGGGYDYYTNYYNYNYNYYYYY
jgi:hypothetical protein